MFRPVLAYTFLVLVPAGLLAFYAFGMTDREYKEELASYFSRLDAEAESFVRRFENAISDGYRQAENVFCGVEDTLSIEGNPWDGDVVGFVEEGKWIGFTPKPKSYVDNLEDSESQIYQQLKSDGKLNKILYNDPKNAATQFEALIEASSEGHFKNLLIYFAGEAFRLSGNKKEAGNYYSLLLNARGSRDLKGLPLNLLASLRLFEIFPQESSRARDVRKILSLQHAALPTDFLEELVRRFFPNDLQFTEVILKRRQLERALPEQNTILSNDDALLKGSQLLLGRRLILAQGRAFPRAIYLSELEVPKFELGDLKLRVETRDFREADLAPEVKEEAGQTLTLKPVRLRERGITVAQVFLWDPLHQEHLSALKTERNLTRWLVGLLVLMSLGGGFILVVYFVKERRLAQLRARLLANVSHELKTPVTSIRMFSEMLAEDPLDEQRTRRFGGLLLAESLRLSRIITNLLDFSWYKNTGQRLPLEPVEVLSVIDRVTDAFSVHAEDCGTILDWDHQVSGWPANKPVVIQSNSGAVERILVNFMDNALKYRGEEKPIIKVRARVDSQGIKISVKDNGKGVPGKDRDKIFEEFYRVDYDDYSIKGAGLGLSICKSLAYKLGGDIQLESKLGQGSEFILSLPFEGEDEELAPAEPD